MTEQEIERLNDVLAADLGRAYNDLPLYKWVRTRDLYYLIEHTVDSLLAIDTYESYGKYSKVTWEQRLGPQFQWMVATWQEPGTESEWKRLYGNTFPYPPQGMYFPLDGSQIPCDPTIDITLEAIAKIKSQLDVPFEALLADMEEKADKEDQQRIEAKRDEIDSDWPAFNCEVAVPGHRPEEKETIQ